MPRLSADYSLCQGHGRCYQLAPEVFDADKEGHTVLKVEDVPAELIEQAESGVENCPELALRLER